MQKCSRFCPCPGLPGRVLRRLRHGGPASPVRWPAGRLPPPVSFPRSRFEAPDRFRASSPGGTLCGCRGTCRRAVRTGPAGLGRLGVAPAGLAHGRRGLAFGWYYGIRWLPVAACGAGTWALLATQDPRYALIIAVASLPGPWQAIRLLRRMAEWKPPEYRLDSVSRFLAVSLLLSAPPQRPALCGARLVLPGSTRQCPRAAPAAAGQLAGRRAGHAADLSGPAGAAAPRPT